MAESDLARQQDSENDKLAEWAMSVDSFVGRLLAILENVDAGYPVALSRTASGAVAVTVSDLLAVLAHPRADQQRAFEQRVLADFCSQRNCAALRQEVEKRDSISFPLKPITPVWSFTTSGPICIGDNGRIEIQFQTSKNMRLYRAQCRQFLAEIQLLKEKVRWHKRHGVTIQLEKITIQSTQKKSEHLLVFNDIGDSALLNVPLIYASPRVFEQVIRWLLLAVDHSNPGKLLVAAKSIIWVSTSME